MTLETKKQNKSDLDKTLSSYILTRPLAPTLPYP